MNTTTEPHWLARLCDPKHAGKRGRTDRPYLVEIDGASWTWASDARVLVAVPGLHAGAMWPDKEVSALVARMVAPGTGDAQFLDVAPLRAWCGPPVWRTDCPACLGQSRRRDEVSCEACDSTGYFNDDVIPGLLYGRPVDRRRLARGLEHVGGACALLYLDPDPEKPLRLHGDGWRICLMPLLDAPEGAPVFPPPAGSPAPGPLNDPTEQPP